MQTRYHELARTLRQEIASGQYAPGSPLPPRMELAERFGVTRSTINRSIQLLIEDGQVESRQGAGTFVAPETQPYLIGFVGVPSEFLGRDMILRKRIHILRYDDLAARSARRELSRYDALIWYLPTSEAMEWVREREDNVPQLVVNRHLPEFNYVSTAHRDAIYQITGERLDAMPEATPVFLATEGDEKNSVTQFREDGFVKACRERKRFYEILKMPDGFAEKLQLLEDRIPSQTNAPIVMVSNSLHNTGAVMSFVHDRKLEWKRNIFYSDFDNDNPASTWGVKVTSFMQDYPRLVELALEKVVDLIEKREAKVQMAIPPIRTDGET